MRVHRRRPPRRHSIGLLTLAVVLTATACNPIFGETNGPVQRAVMTTGSGLTYDYSGDRTTVTAVTPGAFPDGNVREIFWHTEDPFYANQQTCLTWETLATSQPGGLLQPGIATRIAPTPDGTGVRAITVTQNIWYAGVWIVNVHTWDSTRPGNPYSKIVSFDLSALVGRIWYDDQGVLHWDLKEGPWRVCTRTWGDQFSFKIWTLDEPEPAWDDTDHVFSTTLPEGWTYPGYAGGYIGHLREGQTATFGDFTTTPTCLAPDMIDTPACQALLSELPEPGS